jgi:surface antigen
MTRYPNTTKYSPHPRPGTLIFSAVVLAFCGTAWASPAHAQINPFRGYRGPTLTREDLDAGRAAAQKLLDSDQPSVGQAESWTGPTTGNQGTLTIHRVFERARMPCRSIASEVLYQRTQTRRNYTLTACRLAGGAWKLAN